MSNVERERERVLDIIIIVKVVDERGGGLIRELQK